MARLIPPVIDPHTPSPGERHLFEKFSRDPLTRDWTVLHSLDIASHVRQVVGEIDFVLVIPGKGILCLEVKGCSRLRRQGGAWFYGNESTPDYRGPFKQATEGMHSVRKRLIERGQLPRDVVLWYAVVVPFLEELKRFETDEWAPWELVTRQDLQAPSIAPVFEHVLTEARKRLLATPSTAKMFSPGSQEPSLEVCSEIASALRPDFELAETPQSLRTRRADEIRRYTEEQFEALDLLEANARVLFEGPAGTGKTSLAIEAARRAALAGQRVLLLCFNALLAKSLAQETIAYAERILAATIHSFMTMIAGKKVLEQSGEDDFWEKRLPDAALGELLENPEPWQFDVLIVDEAQDLAADQYLDLMEFCVRGGLASGRWAAFGDFEAQRIFSGEGVDAYLRRSSSVVRYPLRVNCRNVPRVAEFAVLLGGLKPGYKRVLRPDSGESPKLLYFESRAEELALLEKTLTELQDEGFAPEEIVVLSGCRGEISGAAEIERRQPSHNFAPLSTSDNGGGLRFGSIHSFKGLESPAVVLTDCDQAFAGTDLFYVGATRATDKLVVLIDRRDRERVVEVLTRAVEA